MEKINIEIRFKIAVLAAAVGFIVGIPFAVTNDTKDGLDLGASVGIGLLFGILGFSALPIIIFEFSSPFRKLYLICGPIGIAFIKLAIKLFTVDSKITKKEFYLIHSYMQKEFGDSILLPLENFMSENEKIEDSILTISKPLQDIKFSARLDVLHRLFVMACDERIVNDEEDKVLKEIAKSLKIGVRRYEMVKNIVFKEKGYKTQAQQHQEQKSQSWNFYMFDQLIKLTYNPFAVLGIEQNASNDEIKKAYRSLAKQHHPDKSMQENVDVRRQHALKIQEINEAYEAIKKIKGIK